jgi:eukaryotic-like serine/threonine-protein kinase
VSFASVPHDVRAMPYAVTPLAMARAPACYLFFSIVSLEVGSVLRGKYRLDASIGRGGMGEVFAATDREGQRVAIKVVRHTGADDLLMARLHREAEAAWRVRSAYVPELFDVDTTDDGELFIVMELLKGETLAERLSARDHVLPWNDVARIGEHVLLGLIDAHEAGVVHRDLKPGNVFLETVEDDLVGAKILDFGVCKLDRYDAEHLTTTGEAVGTVSYMAPEQIRGASKVDTRADVYGFGILIFEALTGRLPHDASGQIAMIASKLERPARHLKESARVAFPPGLDAFIARCLARKPSDRYASARDVLAIWRSFGAATVAPKRKKQNTEDGVSISSSATTRAFAIARRNSKIALVVAASALFALSAVIVLALRNNRASLPPSVLVRSVVVESARSATSTTPSRATPKATAPSAASTQSPLLVRPPTTGL